MEKVIGYFKDYRTETFAVGRRVYAGRPCSKDESAYYMCATDGVLYVYGRSKDTMEYTVLLEAASQWCVNVSFRR